jgi:hypothetical protein
MEFEDQFSEEMILNLHRAEVEPQRATTRGRSVEGWKFVHRDLEADDDCLFKHKA